MSERFQYIRKKVVEQFERVTRSVAAFTSAFDSSFVWNMNYFGTRVMSTFGHATCGSWVSYSSVCLYDSLGEDALV